MTSIFSKVSTFSKNYPIVRGMASYAMIWPASNLCQQAIMGKERFDYAQAGRFCIFGCFFVAPTLHVWLKLAGSMWIGSSLRTAVTKALVEQISYGPAACCCFFFGMSLLEGKSVEDAGKEVSAKFIPTYRVGFLVWPVLQTINFSLIPERNRVPFVSICSFLWTSFLAYMKQLEAENLVKLNHIAL